MEEAETLCGESLKTHDNHYWATFCPGHPGQNQHWSEGLLLVTVKVVQGMSEVGSAQRRVLEQRQGVRNGFGVEKSTRGG